MSARILVIDDEESIRFTFERFLTTEGHIVGTAASCGEALARINDTSFDVVFADIILGDGTGIDILREIRARGLSCPVIMITVPLRVLRTFPGAIRPQNAVHRTLVVKMILYSGL